MSEPINYLVYSTDPELQIIYRCNRCKALVHPSDWWGHRDYHWDQDERAGS